MQLYFLNIRDGSDLTSDPEGSSLPTIEAARNLAIECARQMMGEAVRHGSRIGLERTFEIQNDAGKLLLTVPFRDAINFDAA
jgi:hypothetical protein